MLTESEIDKLVEQNYPGRFHARLLDMITEMKKELKTERNDEYKTQYRILIKKLEDAISDYSYYIHGTYNVATRRFEN